MKNNKLFILVNLLLIPIVISLIYYSKSKPFGIVVFGFMLIVLVALIFLYFHIKINHNNPYLTLKNYILSNTKSVPKPIRTFIFIVLFIQIICLLGSFERYPFSEVGMFREPVKKSYDNKVLMYKYYFLKKDSTITVLDLRKNIIPFIDKTGIPKINGFAAGRSMISIHEDGNDNFIKDRIREEYIYFGLGLEVFDFQINEVNFYIDPIEIESLIQNNKPINKIK
jgi:hypothetical protein